MEQTAAQNEKTKPSLLRKIIDEVDALDEEKQQLLLMQLRKEEILTRAKALDDEFTGKWKALTEDEIADMVSKNRKERYEQKIRD